MTIVGKALTGLLEDEYARQRNAAAEDLHNAIVEIINERQPTIETVLYVLEALKLNLLQPKVKAASPGELATGWRAQREKERGSGIQGDTPSS